MPDRGCESGGGGGGGGFGGGGVGVGSLALTNQKAAASPFWHLCLSLSLSRLWVHSDVSFRGNFLWAALKGSERFQLNPLLAFPLALLVLTPDEPISPPPDPCHARARARRSASASPAAAAAGPRAAAGPWRSLGRKRPSPQCAEYFAHFLDMWVTCGCGSKIG